MTTAEIIHKLIKNYDFFIKAGTAIGGIFLFIKGLKEYRRNSHIKRAEFLDKLIVEFSKSENIIALKLLDDFIYVREGDKNKSSEEQMANAVKFEVYLRDHRKEPIKNDDEIIVRRSFDNLLDFFTKLSYYLQNGLITSKELIYFRYYINKIEQKKAVIKYIEVYFYPCDFEKLFEAVKKLK